MAGEDALASFGLEPAQMTQGTLDRLDAILPDNWSRGNPVDILGDTPASTYVETVKICAADPDTDVLLLICSPAGTVDTRALAEHLVPCLREISCLVFTAWIGGENVAGARQMGIRHVTVVVLAENTQMLKLGRKLGFTIKRMTEGGEYELIIETQDLNID